MSIRNYKLELVDPSTGDIVAFGPRTIGDYGRDILVVKKALGQLKPFSELIDEEDQESLIDFEGAWLDCSDGTALSNFEASKFDRNMQTYLTKFQLDNQFYILCYLFSKFSVNQNFEEINELAQRGNLSREQSDLRLASGGIIPRVPRVETGDIDDYLNSYYTSTQIDIISRLFNLELGSLGEATIAVLHGWRPRTTVGETSYFHDPKVFNSFDGAYDVVLLGLYNAFTEGMLTQKISASPDVLEPRNPVQFDKFRGDQRRGAQNLGKYRQQVATKELVQFTIVGESRPEDYTIKSSYFGTLKYRVVNKSERSPLYSAFLRVSEEVPRGADSGIDQDLSDEAFKEALLRAYEPNPLLDPDPFIVDSNRIMYFYKTEYTLEGGSIPPDPQTSQDEIRRLEELALEQVLNFYGKPLVWVQDPSNPRFETLYGYDLEVRPNHNGTYANQDQFVLSTNNFLTKQEEQSSGSPAYAQDFRIIEGDNIELPLVRFVEFISPSLRPTDKYRARFEISKKKLDNIIEGAFDLDEQERSERTQPEAEETTGAPTSNTEDINQNFTCEGEQVSKEEQEKRYKEYKALAAKRKREIARTIREKSVENYNNKTPITNSTVDLGVFGNTTLDLGDSTDSYSYTANVISSITGLAGGAKHTKVNSPTLSDITTLEVTYIELQTMCESAAKNLTKAFKNCIEDNVTISPRNFNGYNEARRIRQIPGEIRAFIEKRTQKKKRPDTFLGRSGDQLEEATGAGSNFDFGTDNSNNLNFSGFLGTGSKIKFSFDTSNDGKGLQVTGISASGKELETKNLVKEVKSLAYPRTVGYLGQIEIMSSDLLDILGFRSEACQSLGIGRFGLSYIMKHTIGLTSNKRGEFNPISKWASNEITALQDRVKEFKSINQLEEQLNVKFGVDDVLSVFGKQCSSIESTMRNLFKRYSFGGILCDLLRCIRFPAVSFSVPDITSIKRLLSLVDISIFGWYKDLVDNLVKIFFGLLTQFLCTFAKALIDILNQPFCKEQLRDQLYGSGANSTSPIKRALVEGLTDLSLSPENVEKSKDLIDSMAVFLTGEELCRILQGGPIDGPTMTMILALADNLGIEETNTEEKLKEFFETISIFLPAEFCDNLSKSTTIIDPADCSEVATYTSQVRRRLLANEATDEEIQRALDIANKNLQDQYDSLKAFSTSGINGIVPKVLKFGDPSAMISDLPEILSQQINRSAKSLFTPAHTGYVSSLSRFGPALFETTLRPPQPGDDSFSEQAYLITHTILQNLRLFQTIGGAVQAPDKNSLTRQLHVLYQVYEVEKLTPNGPVIPVFYYKINVGGDNAPQDLIDGQGYVRIPTLEALSEIDDMSRVFLKPTGFLENNYYFETPGRIEEPEIINPPIQERKLVSKEDLARPLSGTTRKETIQTPFGPREITIPVPSHLDGFSFIGAYKMMEKAEKDGLFTSPTEGVESFLLGRIQQRLGEMQAALQANLQTTTTPVNDRGYLRSLKESLSYVFENAQENKGETTGQLIWSRNIEGNEENDERQVMALRLGLGRLETSAILTEFPSTDSTSKFDPYMIDIPESPLFQEKQFFEFCDTVPGPGYKEEELTQEQIQNRDKFERLTNNIPPGIFTRREIFARKFWESVNAKINFIYDRPEEGNPEQKQIVGNYLSPESAIRRHIYNEESVKFSEGMMEQIFYALENSRIYNLEQYYDELNARVSGLSYFDDTNECFKNRYNISQFGILSFEKMVTDDLAEQISRELAKPENDPYNRDFDDLDPTQKAIQNVCMLGFIRVCIVELMLKGALAYSVWDMESVIDDPFMKEFFIRFVEEEIKRHPSLLGKWEPVASRISGVDQPQFAIRELVQDQMLKVVGVSKKIFQNEAGLDYYNWFIKTYIPQVEVSKEVSGGRDLVGRQFVGRLDVDAEGDVTRRDITERISGRQKVDFIWEHPLARPQNIIIPNEEEGQLSSRTSISDSLLGSQNHFFHIEHLIEVTGPLARLENLVIPSRTTVQNIIDNLQTNVESEYRDRRTLIVKDAFERTNLPPIDLDEYDLRNIPEIEGSAAGTSAEIDGLNKDHEIYNIDDFVSGISSIMNEDNLQKIVLHHRGLMHYDESDNPAGGEFKNTTFEAANAMPEAIRRTPTRFVKKIRRIIKFSKDFVSHENNNYFSLDNELSRYKASLYSTSERNSGYGFENSPSAQSTNDALIFWQMVSKGMEDQNEYYVLTSNGEELAELRAEGVDFNTASENEAFLEHLMGINLTGVSENRTEGAYVDYSFEEPEPRKGFTICVKPSDSTNRIVIEQNDRYVPDILGEHYEQMGKGRNVSKNTDLNTLPSPGAGDFLTTRKLGERNSQSRAIFENLYGKIDNLEEFERLKSVAVEPHQETWVETVFDFSDQASIIAGFHGTFSIGDTMDPAVRNFTPDQNLVSIFNDSLKNILTEIYGDDAYENASDETLSFNKVIMLQQEDDNVRPFIARHMGPAVDSNNQLTKYEIAEDPGQNTINTYPSFVLDESSSDETKARISQGDHRVNIVKNAPGALEDYTNEMFDDVNDLLPPNFYKIPMRVLVTQIFDSGVTIGDRVINDNTAREVYCRVVLPEYIRNMYDERSEENNISKLNAALTSLANEYINYYNVAADENAPGLPPQNVDFTTDFTRDHESDFSNVVMDSRRQYCSIESIYYRVFEQEVKNRYYNSKEELDALFSNRGALVIDRPRPRHDDDYFPGVERDSKVFIDTRQYLESCSQLYRVDTDITKEPGTQDKVSNFHNTIFSLSNIFQWYLRNRRRDTLWGHLTPPLTYFSTEKVTTSLGAGFRSFFHFPRNQSRKIAGRKQIKHLSLRNHILIGDSELERRADESNIYEEGLHSWTDEGTESNNLYNRFINKKDFSNWTFYSGITPGLISDGKGVECANYNYIESCPFKNTGTSLFYGNGIISHNDISNFISSCVRKLINDSYFGVVNLGQGPVSDFLDLETFFGTEDGINNQILGNMVKFNVIDPEVDMEQNFIFTGEEEQLGFEGFSSNRFVPDKEYVKSLLRALEKMFLRLYALAASQGAFSIKSEASRYNRQVLEAPYKFAIIARFISKIYAGATGENPIYTPQQQIFLLSMTSAYNFSDSLQKIYSDTDVDLADDLDKAPDSELLDWAAACIHFCAAMYQKYKGDIPRSYGSSAGLFRVFSYGRVDMRGGRYYVYRKRGKRQTGVAHGRDEAVESIQGIELFPGGNLMYIAGPRQGNWADLSVTQAWLEIRDLIESQGSNAKNKTNFSIKQIIKLSNKLVSDMSEVVGVENAVEGETYQNNNLILELLLNPEFNIQPMIDRYSQRYRNALARANTARSDLATRNTIVQEIRNNSNSRITKLFLSRENADSLVRDTMQIEEFVTRLDNRLFYNIFGDDNNPRIFHSSMSFFENYFQERYRPKLNEETLSEYYKDMVSNLLYRVPSFKRSFNSISAKIRNIHFSAPQRITDRWNQSFSRYTGITEAIMTPSIFNEAFVSGELVSGLFENSEIKQVCRLVSNVPTNAGEVEGDELEYTRLVSSETGPIQQISEEFRSFRMAAPGGGEIFSVPLAEYNKMISAFGQGLDDCYDISTFKEDYKRLQPWMLEQLVETDEAKQIFQYVFPVKRYQSVATAFVTSALAGYGNMVNIMQTPKASLAALLGLAGLSRNESSQLFDNFSQAEFMKQMMDSNASENALDCFGFPFPDDFLKQFEDLLAELFSQFPSIFFRGIAQAIDPAYKEMRQHYMNCNIGQLTMRGLEGRTTVKKGNMTAGVAHKNKPLGDQVGKYGSVIYSAPVDISYGVYRAFYGDFRKLGRALERLTGYIIKGPVSLLDGAFNFSIPCKGIDKNWSAGPWNADRYGHPLTPFTLLALITDELPGDRRLRDCAVEPPTLDDTRICSDEEEPPFGSMPNPED